MKQNVRISRKMLQILLDRITSSLSLSIPLKDFKCYGGGGGGGGEGEESRFQVTRLIEGFLGG